MRKLWLTFCQTATVCLAVLFVVSTLRPDLLAWTTPQGDVGDGQGAAARGAAGGRP